MTVANEAIDRALRQITKLRETFPANDPSKFDYAMRLMEMEVMMLGFDVIADAIRQPVRVTIVQEDDGELDLPKAAALARRVADFTAYLAEKMAGDADAVRVDGWAQSVADSLANLPDWAGKMTVRG